jgi:hypothetical protein
MHMPTRNQKVSVADEHGEASSVANLVHQMHVEHEANSLSEFADALQDNAFIVVEEFYRNPGTGAYYSRGPVAINTLHVGKVKEYESRN